ncbi:MAG: glycosyltransferase family 1 protein [Micavibrio sp.]
MRQKQLLIDVSVILQDDARTGIQRVVRALYLQLYKSPPDGFTVRPVFATRKRGYRYAPLDFLEIRRTIPEMNALNVTVSAGDIFLGLDLTTHLLPLRIRQFLWWKWRGMKFYGFVYDLLPLVHQDWFDKKLASNFKRWAKVIVVFSDGIFCISSIVRRDVRDFLARKLPQPANIETVVIPLGADIENTSPSMEENKAVDSALTMISLHKAVLMVGTLEPRKGHKSILEAFEVLWQKGDDTPLLFIGRRGWKMEDFIEEIIRHPQFGKNLFWLEGANDNHLRRLYQECRGLIMASRAEGLGLPLLEAVRFGMPVLARDIEVFKEHSSDYISYFPDGDTYKMADTIRQWYKTLDAQKKPQELPEYSWACSAKVLKTHIK